MVTADDDDERDHGSGRIVRALAIGVALWVVGWAAVVLWLVVTDGAP